MISIDRSSSRTTLVYIAMALLAGSVLGWWWFRSQATIEPGKVAPMVASAPVAGAVMSIAPAASGSAPHLPSPAEAGSDLRNVLVAQPNGEQEFNRVAVYIHFQKLFERFQGLTQESKDIKLRQAAAQQLYDMLPDRVRQMELTLPEGMLLCSVFLAEIEPNNETLRNQRLEGCGKDLEKVAPKIETEEQIRAAQCQQEFRRRESTLVYEYQSQLPNARNPAKLEKDLDAAKRAVFDSPTCGL